jgi:hypothetical protein
MGGKITIHSDGTPMGTVVITENGEKLENVTSATVYLDAREVTQVHLEVVLAPLIINGEIRSWNFVCPVCGEGFEHECNGKASSMGGGGATFKPTSVPIPTLANPTATMTSLPSSGQICGAEMQEKNPDKNYTCWILDNVAHDTHIDITQGVGWNDTPPYSKNRL